MIKLIYISIYKEGVCVWWGEAVCAHICFQLILSYYIGPMDFSGSSPVSLGLHICLLFFTWGSNVVHLTLSLLAELAILSCSVSALFICM